MNEFQKSETFPPRKILRNFIVLEGGDGSGTTTQLHLLDRHLKENEIPSVCTCEPTTSPIGRLIRGALSGSPALAPTSLTLLFAADRAQHLYGEKAGISAQLAAGKLVISDRYLFSSLAYQTLDVESSIVFDVNGIFPLPEYLFYFRVPPEVSLARKIRQTPKREVFDSEALQIQIQENYERILKQFSSTPMKIIYIDATKVPALITQQILKKLPLHRWGDQARSSSARR